MVSSVIISPIDLQDLDISDLRTVAHGEGFGFVERLFVDWESGANRFDETGELFCGAFHQKLLVGFGGVNIDPYISAAGVGRIRHLYVLPAYRRKGIVRQLLEVLVFEGGKAFECLRLRTDTKEAAKFYENRGFERAVESTATHQIRPTVQKPGSVVLGNTLRQNNN
jgi:ribosomal protein S18 acetylase RimI-like enzyme